MIKNYITIAWRNFVKGKIYSVINIFGMGLGIGICLLIFLFVQEEKSYDKFHSNSDHIYRAWVKEHYKGDIFFNSITPYLLGSELKDNFPEIDQMVRYTSINTLIRNSDRVQEESVHLVDPSFFKMFDFSLQLGSSEVLQNIHNAAISSRIANKYFGEESPIGQNLNIQIGGEWTDFTVNAVVENTPSNSSLLYDIIIPFENTTAFMSEGGRQCWTCVSVETYVMLNDKSNISAFEQTIAPFIDKKVADEYEPGEYLVGFQPISDIHLNSDIPSGFANVSDSRYIYILSAIALLILLLACINFTTLSVGRAVSRSKEVGIRKVTGATRTQLMIQFWSEAFMTVLAGIILGIFLAKTGLPYFNELADKQLILSISPSLIIGLIALFLFTGLTSGLYPALILSGFKPINALHSGKQTGRISKGSLLNGLVGFQFVLSVILIICTVVMQNQMHFLQNKNLGYEKSQIVSIPYNVSGLDLADLWMEGKKIQQRLEDHLVSNSSILGITSSSHVFGSQGWLGLGYTDQEQDRFRRFNAVQVDEDFLPLMGINVNVGRNFSKDTPTDASTVIINKAMIQEFGLSDPIGKFLPSPFNDFQVIGVTGDFNFSSLHNPVDPLVMAYDLIPMFQISPDISYVDRPNPKISIKIASSNLPQTIGAIQNAWQEVAEDQAFSYSFIDDNVDRQYSREEKLSAVLSWSTLIALIVACMGLFGISALKMAYKTKEIGIRKVLGASSVNILKRLSEDYIKLIFLAAIIASPIAWIIMNKWLEDFAFHVDIDWWIFALAASLTAIIALIVVSYQSINAAWADPVEALRDE